MTTAVTTSVVFTDLVGWSELSSGLRPTDAEEILSVYLGLLRGALASTGGVEVKGVGDGLMVTFSSLSGALDAAVAMQQSVERHSPSAAMSLGLRIGLSTGDATEEDGDFFGEPIVEAARLCAAAAGGQILTTELVALLARRGGHRFESVGALELHGLPEPVAAHEVLWEPARTVAQVPLPRRLDVHPTGGVLGRVPERERLSGAVKAVMAGEGARLVLMSGEPGIGKSTLASDIARHAHEQGAIVLYGRCEEELALPYQPFVEALGVCLAELPEVAMTALDERFLREMSRLLPQIRQRMPSLTPPDPTDSDAERYLLFGAVTGVLSALAEQAPVVVVLDDLHWADKPTVLLLCHLVARLEGAAVLLVATYREGDLTDDHPLTEALAALQREPTVDRLAIGGLDDAEIVALLEGFAGHAIGADGVGLAHALQRETGGNPFFTAEVLRHLAEVGALRQEAGRWVAGVDLSQVSLPDSVREVVGQRVRRIGDGARRVLTLASVIGRDFDLSVVARVAALPEEEVLAALEAATGAQVVNEVPGHPERFTFVHALFQHSLYAELSSSRRARLHRTIAETLEADQGADLGDRIGEIARHWIEAAPIAGVTKAAAYAQRAGDNALQALAPDEAIRWFRDAINLLDDDRVPHAVQRLDAVIGLGDAQRQAGDPSYRETLLEATAAADRQGDADRLVAAALANQRGTVSSAGAVDIARIETFERALAALDGSQRRARALLLSTLAAELPFSGDHPRARAVADEAERIARDLGDDRVLLRVLNWIFGPLWVPDLVERNATASAEALDLASRVGDRVGEFWAAINRISAMASMADRDELDAALELAVHMTEEIGQPYLDWQMTLARSPHMLLLGRVEEAERLAEHALQVGMDSGQPDALAGFGANLAGIRWHQGRVEEILPLIAEAAADNPGLPAFQAAHAQMLCECGHMDEAAPLLERARGTGFVQSSYDWTWLTTATLWADTAAWLGDVAACETIYPNLLPFERQGVCSGATFSGTVSLYLARVAAVLGRHEAARAHFERADAQLEALQAPFWRARNQIEWARLLAESGRHEDLGKARELLASAASAATHHGCAGLERRAAELAARLPAA